MCGIAGVYQNRKTEKEELKRAIELMNRSQVCRGPDDEGVFINEENGLALGHRRLSIIDLSSAGHQPMEYNGNEIVFNGEIYNFKELRSELIGRGREFRTKTDTETILAAYEEYGENAFLKLRGMFAFALWDFKRKKLFLVKDRYGIKPLYYRSDKNNLIFASTVGALEKSGTFSPQKNIKAFMGFLLFGYVPLPLTTLDGVFAIPAGHYLVKGENGEEKLVRYYEPLRFFEEKNDIRFDVAVLEVKKILKESVNFHLISDAPLGVFLSGGLDSSAIAALASLDKKDLATLSIVFEEEEFSEKKYQEAVARKIGSNHREVKIVARDFYDSLGSVFEAMDQPTVDGVNTFFIAKAAKEAGLKAVLSGLGSDEIFCGYSSFKKAILFGRIQKMPSVFKSPLGIASLLGGRYKKLNYFKSKDPLSFYLSVRGLLMPNEVAKMLKIKKEEVLNFMNEISGTLPSERLRKLHPVDLLSYMEINFYLQSQLLKDTDFMSMRHSIETRVPFLDHKLVEYLSGLPADLKLGAINKPLLVEAVRDLLPPEILTRKKMGFTFPFEKWFREKNRINPRVHWSRFWARLVLEKFIK